MMHGSEKSDSAIRAMKPANKAGQPAAERVEQRAGTKGNTNQPRTRRTQSRASVSPGLERVRHAARQRKKEKFTALLHHVTVDSLRDAFLALKRHAAPGVDGVTWQDYEADLEANLQSLNARVHRGTYRALPVRRRFIPKPDGRQRPLGIAALEDKIVQRAIVTVLNAIYEEDFVGFSYGFRPKRSQHDALDALSVAICDTPVNWILDADIRGFLDRASQCPQVYDGWSKRSGCLTTTLIRKPFCRPRRMMTASSSPRFTCCNTVWRESPRRRVATCMAT